MRVGGEYFILVVADDGVADENVDIEVHAAGLVDAALAEVLGDESAFLGLKSAEADIYHSNIYCEFRLRTYDGGIFD